jgi:hypothetical protein
MEIAQYFGNISPRQNQTAAGFSPDLLPSTLMMETICPSKTSDLSKLYGSTAQKTILFNIMHDGEYHTKIQCKQNNLKSKSFGMCGHVVW